MGTIVKKMNGKIVCELRKHEQKFIAARGGLGEIERLVKESQYQIDVVFFV